MPCQRSLLQAIRSRIRCTGSLSAARVLDILWCSRIQGGSNFKCGCIAVAAPIGVGNALFRPDGSRQHSLLEFCTLCPGIFGLLAVAFWIALGITWLWVARSPFNAKESPIVYKWIECCWSCLGMINLLFAVLL